MIGGVFQIEVFSSFFASYDAINEYRGDRNVARKLLTVDGNDNFRRLPYQGWRMVKSETRRDAETLV